MWDHGRNFGQRLVVSGQHRSRSALECGSRSVSLAAVPALVQSEEVNDWEGFCSLHCGFVERD